MKKVILVLLCIAMVPFLCTSAFATDIPFGDSSNYWPTWNNGTADDNVDVIGTPNITGGTAVVNNGTLDSVSFDYSSYSSAGYVAGDLFIDIAQDGTWDYVVDATTGGIFQVAVSVTDHNAAYDLSNDFGWGTANYRQDHVVGYDTTGLTAVGTASVMDFTNNPLVFGNLGIDLGGHSFTIGFAPTCANDVIYEKVPEPSAALFLGGILFGLGALGRRRFLKR